MGEPAGGERIESLVEEEHRLWDVAGRRPLEPEEHARLEAIRADLDRSWDALRRRRANPVARGSGDPAPDPPNDLDGPDPEPLHLDHGVRPADVGTPDPGINPNAP
jgi:Protein of unknown function (DUF2630)